MMTKKTLEKLADKKDKKPKKESRVLSVRIDPQLYAKFEKKCPDIAEAVRNWVERYCE